MDRRSRRRHLSNWRRVYNTDFEYEEKASSLRSRAAANSLSQVAISTQVRRFAKQSTQTVSRQLQFWSSTDKLPASPFGPSTYRTSIPTTPIRSTSTLRNVHVSPQSPQRLSTFKTPSTITSVAPMGPAIHHDIHSRDPNFPTRTYSQAGRSETTVLVGCDNNGGSIVYTVGSRRIERACIKGAS